MNRAVSPVNGPRVPSSPLALSIRRSEVEPTATMRPPARRVAFKAAAVSALTPPHAGMHDVIRGVFGLDRQEGPRPDMQGHGVRASTPWACRPATELREMEAGGRRRHRPSVSREHGLIIAAVVLIDLAAARDIGRQRHLAALAQRLVEHGAGERKREVTSPPSPFVPLAASSWSRKQTLPSLPNRTMSPGTRRFAGFTKARQRAPSSRQASPLWPAHSRRGRVGGRAAWRG